MESEDEEEEEDDEDNDDELFAFSISEDCESDPICNDSPLLPLLSLSLVDSKLLLFIESVPDSNSSRLPSILVSEAVLILSPLQTQYQ